MTDPVISIRTNSFPTDKDLNRLMQAAWPNMKPSRYQQTLRTCLVHLTAHDADKLVGFVKMATDGGKHAFLLDPTVHPDYRRSGLGTRLVKAAISEAKANGATFVHVDYEPHLERFYEGCGFEKSRAGLLRL